MTNRAIPQLPRSCELNPIKKSVGSSFTLSFSSSPVPYTTVRDVNSLAPRENFPLSPSCKSYLGDQSRSDFRVNAMINPTRAQTQLKYSPSTVVRHTYTDRRDVTECLTTHSRMPRYTINYGESATADVRRAGGFKGSAHESTTLRELYCWLNTV